MVLIRKAFLSIGKSVFSLLLLFTGILLVRRVCSLPKVFSLELLIPIAIGFAFIFLASFLASKVLCLRFRTFGMIGRETVFASFLTIVLLFLSFAGGHGSLYSFISRIGHNGIVPGTKIVVRQGMPAIAPRKAVDIADSYLRVPVSDDSTTRESYVKTMYRDVWMKKVVVSTVPYSFIQVGHIYKLPTDKTYNENERLYEVSLYFNRSLPKGEDWLIVYIDREGNVVGLGSWVAL